jgi:hypothetical protein
VNLRFHQITVRQPGRAEVDFECRHARVRYWTATLVRISKIETTPSSTAFPMTAQSARKETRRLSLS